MRNYLTDELRVTPARDCQLRDSAVRHVQCRKKNVVLQQRVKPISHHRRRPDKTVLSGWRRRCEQSWRQFSVVFNILATD